MQTITATQEMTLIYKYILVHQHEYGTTLFAFQSPEADEGQFDLIAIAHKLGVDFEEDKGDSLIICPMPDLLHLPIVKAAIVEVCLPAHLAPYLINGDGSGITDEEAAEIDQYLAIKGYTIVGCPDGEPEFKHGNDLHRNIGGDCYIFTAKCWI